MRYVGSTQMLVLALLRAEPTHGYGLSRALGPFGIAKGSVHHALKALVKRGAAVQDEKRGAGVYAITRVGRGELHHHAMAAVTSSTSPPLAGAVCVQYALAILPVSNAVDAVRARIRELRAELANPVYWMGERPELAPVFVYATALANAEIAFVETIMRRVDGPR